MADTTQNHLPILFVLGGTFNPFHNGHLAVLNHLHKQFPYARIHILPNRKPVHKLNSTHHSHRTSMLAQALDQSYITIDHTDIDLPQENYTLYTLQALRKKWPHSSLAWVMGDDVFHSIETWGNWEDLLNYAHFYLLPRTQPAYSSSLLHALQKYDGSVNELHQKTHGYTIFDNQFSPLDISSSDIRRLTARNQPISHLVPEQVATYIQKHHLYLS